MKIRINQGRLSSNTICEKGRDIYRDSVEMTIKGDSRIFTSFEFGNLPFNINTQKEAHEYIQNKIGNTYRLMLSWGYINHNFTLNNKPQHYDY